MKNCVPDELQTSRDFPHQLLSDAPESNLEVQELLDGLTLVQRRSLNVAGNSINNLGSQLCGKLLEHVVGRMATASRSSDAGSAVLHRAKAPSSARMRRTVPEKPPAYARSL